MPDRQSSRFATLRKLRRGCLALGAALTFAGLIWAQAEGSISGIINDATGAPIAGVSVSGSLEPAHTILVKSQIAGRLRRILVERGTRVTKGQLMAELEAEGIRGQAASARATVPSSRARQRRHSGRS